MQRAKKFDVSSRQMRVLGGNGGEIILSRDVAGIVKDGREGGRGECV